MRREILWIGLCIGLLLLLIGQGVSQGAGRSASLAAPNSVGTAFAYQGSLANSLGPVTGDCDLRLTLYGQASGGAAVAGPVTLNRVSVQNGLFSVQVDFGPGVFTGDSRWLETAVRCPAGQGAFATLSPRQAISPVPYALYAVEARQSLEDFTVQDELWVGRTAILGGPDAISGLSLRAPDVYLNADPSYQRGKGGRALVHDVGNTLALNYANDFSGGVRIGGNTTITGELTVGRTAILGGPEAFSGLSLRAPDVYLNADPSYQRGKGGRALVHDWGNTLALNYANDFSGGVRIGSNTTITGELTVEGKTFRLLGWDLYMNAGADRGDGGRALVHGSGDRLVVNFEGDFAGGVDIDSSTRILGELGVFGPSLQLYGPDLYINGGTDRGDGGRALVHTDGDTLVINYANDFAGDVLVQSDLTVQGEMVSTGPLRARNDVYVEGGSLIVSEAGKSPEARGAKQAAGLLYVDVAERWSRDARPGDLILRAGEGGRLLLGRSGMSPEQPTALVVEPTGLVYAHELQADGLIEDDLQRAAAQATSQTPQFDEGDVLCWNPIRRIPEPCGQIASPLVVAVANRSGRPLIAGVTRIKVVGEVQPGDLLVSSDTVGYAVAWRTFSSEATPPGVVIAKALEANEAGEGLIQALITLR